MMISSFRSNVVLSSIVLFFCCGSFGHSQRLLDDSGGDGGEVAAAINNNNIFAHNGIVLNLKKDKDTKKEKTTKTDKKQPKANPNPTPKSTKAPKAPKTKKSKSDKKGAPTPAPLTTAPTPVPSLGQVVIILEVPICSDDCATGLPFNINAQGGILDRDSLDLLAVSLGVEPGDITEQIVDVSPCSTCTSRRTRSLSSFQGLFTAAAAASNNNQDAGQRTVQTALTITAPAGAVPTVEDLDVALADTIDSVNDSLETLGATNTVTADDLTTSEIATASAAPSKFPTAMTLSPTLGPSSGSPSAAPVESHSAAPSIASPSEGPSMSDYPSEGPSMSDYPSFSAYPSDVVVVTRTQQQPDQRRPKRDT